MVMVLPAKPAVTPAGKPEGAPMPVAPVVVCVMFVIAVLIQTVGELEAGVTVLSGVTIIVPVALIVPQPPVNGIE
ncbi:MAG: hypothetical protein KFKLKKLM_02430 [Flavobacteriales bacterium]|nr:hypothetical protein [Flavobacteriales bacterium]